MYVVYPLPPKRLNIVGSLSDREVACSASDRQVLNFESCVWRAVSSQQTHNILKTFKCGYVNVIV